MWLSEENNRTNHLSESIKKVGVVGAGLAGSDCAWVLAEHYGLNVILYEMKPQKMTPAQIMPESFAELVCSNSLKSTSLLNPAGLLKQDLRALGSLVCHAALDAQVPAGESLAVGRERFSGMITKTLRNHPRIEVRAGVVGSARDLLRKDELELIVIATGPLTEGGLNEELQELSGKDCLYFYDAIAPILDGSSLNRSIIFAGNRESRAQDHQETEAGVGDYLNIPLSREEYDSFVKQVLDGEKVPHHDFEEPRYFNGCQPIENLAESGPLTLAHGPMKGRGLTDPRTGRWPYAAIQLRKEKLGDEAYNMVGFQTRLNWREQKRIFQTLPGMSEAVFHRMGSMHRNTYLCAPELLSTDFTFKSHPQIALAGQIMGVEGYLESSAMGCFLGHHFGTQLVHSQRLELPPASTPLGGLCHHVLHNDPKSYSPMNVHWGLIAPLSKDEILNAQSRLSKENAPLNIRERKDGTLKLDKGTKRMLLSDRSQRHFADWMERNIQGHPSR